MLEGNLNRIKKEYGENTIVLDYEGEAKYIKDFAEIENIDDYGRFMEVKLKEGGNSQDLLQYLTGKIRINKFEVKEPTLNAIFIDKVGEQNEKNSGGN